MKIIESRTKHRTRMKIVDMASHMFIQNGIEQTTIKDILEKIELDRQTFYNYYDDKKDLADYIFRQSLETFYAIGFEENQYMKYENGYQKFERYLKTLLERYIQCIDESVYLAQYDYYNQDYPDQDVITDIYHENKIFDPCNYFIEGVADGSISIGNHNPYELFFIISQSIGAYTNRVLIRQYRTNNIDTEAISKNIKILIDMHLQSVKSNKKA